MAVEGRADSRSSEGLWDLDAPTDPVQMLWRVATWEYDPVTEHVYWLDAPGEVLGIDDETARSLVDPIVVSLEHGAPWERFDLERNVTNADGAPVDVRVQARRLAAPEGHDEPGCVGVAIDISEQRRTERNLRGVIDRYRRLVELSPDIVVVHQDGLIRYINPEGLRVAKVDDADDMIGRSILDFVHPASVEETLERIATLTEPGMASEPSEAVMLASDGTAVAMESVSVRTEWDGEPAFQVILRDISERRRAEAALRHQASLVEHVSDAIIATDTEGGIVSWNPAAEVLYGHRAADVIGKTMGEVLGAGAVDRDGRPVSGEAEHQTVDGRWRSVLVSVARLRDEIDEDAGLVVMCADLTERFEREAAEAQFAAAVAVLDEGVAVIDPDGFVLSVNGAARALLGDWLRAGVHASEIAKRFPLVNESGNPMPPDEHPLLVALETGSPQHRVVVGVVDDSWPRWVSTSVRAMEVRHSTRHGAAMVWSFSDITERKRAEERLRLQATHDWLTNLPNRNLAQVQLRQALVAARADGVPVAVLWLDLDRFKMLNDSLGHLVGDEVLKQVAARLRSAARQGERLGRLSGDEFLVVCPGTPTIADAHARASELADEVSRPMRVGRGSDIVVTTSIGVTLSDGHATLPETVLHEADMAMRRAKQRGRSRVEVFDDQMRSTLSRRISVERALGDVVEGDAITLHYQPIVTIDGGSTVGVEALARWTDPALGAIGPSEFVPVAEETGLMSALGTSVLRRACREAAGWNEAGDELTMVSVNVSPRQFTDPAFVDMTASALEETGLDPDRLWFEVTESVLVEEDVATAEILAGLRGLGVHLAIDDFGTGYSSLGYLKDLPVEAVKLDQSFVAGLGSEPEADAIVEAIIRLGQALGLVTIAEGVEDEAQLERLRGLGCDLAQGLLFAPPMEASKLGLG